MPEGTYAIDFDASAGRAYVNVQGALSAKKIRNTFAAIALNDIWANGDRAVLWQARRALFPPSFEFADIFKTTQLSKAFTKPGKSAIVVAQNSEMVKRVARFYQSIALTETTRNINVFFDEDAAVAWLDE
jgi:hypothetical protein